jgi:hypothetical protein
VHYESSKVRATSVANEEIYYLCTMTSTTTHIVAFTGHRNYDRRYDDLLLASVEELVERGARCFRVGMAEGFDLAAAAVV